MRSIGRVGAKGPWNFAKTPQSLNIRPIKIDDRKRPTVATGASIRKL